MRLVGRTYCVSEHQWCTVHQGPEICLLLCQCLSICLWVSGLVFIFSCVFVLMSVSDSSSPVCLWLYLHLSVCLFVCLFSLLVCLWLLSSPVCLFICLPHLQPGHLQHMLHWCLCFCPVFQASFPRRIPEQAVRHCSRDALLRWFLVVLQPL